MSDIINDTVKINKVHTNPKRGHKLGTASATWKKIKSATVTATLTSTYPLATPNTSTNTSDDDTIDLENPSKNVLIENGPSGEFFMLFAAEHKLEFWNWTSPKQDSNTSDYGDTLFLNHQIELPFEIGTDVQAFKLFAQQEDEYIFLIIISDQSGYYLQSHRFSLKDKTTTIISSLELQYGSPKMTLKASDRFAVVGSDTGLSSIFRFVQGKLFPGNHNLQLPTIRKHSCNPILAKHSFTKVSDEDMILQTSINSDSVPIFDIVDNWFVYSPTKFEYKHLKAINESTITQPKSDEEDKDPILTNIGKTATTNKTKNSMFTPMKLPISKPLLNKVFSTVSNTALDGLFKLSEVSSAKLKAYMNQPGTATKPVEPTTMNSISKSVGKLLYSTASNTANSLQNTTKSLKPNDNQIICVLDLGNDRVMGTFKPPGGVSQLSLSPYDLQLVHANSRGDSLYMWDLYRLPIEISLIGKFIRGKTSAIIEEIFWFINNYESKKDEGEVFGNNSGFGCISKSTGSLHWYNINYLAGSYNNNRPNSFKKTSFAPGKFMDSWILSSLKAKQFVSTPTNKPSNLNQLAIIDENLVLKLISPLNGHHFYQFQLSKLPVDSQFVPEVSTIEESNNETLPYVNPLSQAEIETCAPFLNLINNRRIEFATFEEENLQGFFLEFGNSIPEKEITFRSKPTYRTLKPKDVKVESEMPSLETLFIDQDEGSDDPKDISDFLAN